MKHRLIKFARKIDFPNIDYERSVLPRTMIEIIVASLLLHFLICRLFQLFFGGRSCIRRGHIIRVFLALIFSSGRCGIDGIPTVRL
jgi:hypothetical protein